MPYNFSWVLPGRLAGLSLPGLGEGRDLRRGGLAAELAELRGLGLDCLVSLTDQAAGFGPACAAAGLSWEYFPIPEFDVPEDRPAFHRLVERLLGRLEGLPGKEAIRRLRLLRPALETPDQERFVASYLRSGPAG